MSRRRLLPLGANPQLQAQMKTAALVAPCGAADVRFLDEARVAPTTDRLGHSLWPYRRMCLAFWNLRLCASMQHGAAL